MKLFLNTLFFFLLITQICFGQNGYIDRDNSQVIIERKETTDSTILIKRIDHISAYYNSIAEVDSIQSLFNRILELPQWFSPAIRDVVSPPNSKFYNTGVYLGNVFLEFITFNIDTLNPPPPTYIPYFNAFAFANEITNTAAILDSRGIPRSQVFHYLFREPDQTILTLFSTITLTNFNNNDLLVFFCQYHPELFDCESFDFGNLPAITNPDSQHIYFGNLVDSLNGGPLTLSKVKNIVLTSNNFENYRQKLNTLFFPTEEDEPGKWSPPAGPSLFLQSSQTTIKLTTLNIAVDSLQAAREFLIANGLGFEDGGNYLKLNLSTNIGVDIILSDIITLIDDQINFISDDFVLHQNYPNPFNPSTVISYQLPVSSDVTLKVYDILGNEIATLVNEEKPAGTYEVEFNIYSDEGRNLSSGIYFYQIKVGGSVRKDSFEEINSGQGFIETKKMILLR
ncbi:MAG TPA: T9SS type A sorting domain-containing protein [Ignavibacteriaceae bacterium]|nr:T9SS type A sorting domain-containing protein [Ignavibacteriaceae bacterium]